MSLANGKQIVKKSPKPARAPRFRYSKKCFVDGCEKMFSFHQELDAHMKNVHPDVKPFVCDFCGDAFSFIKSLTEHKSRYCLAKNDPNDEKPHPCDQCPKRFSTSTMLSDHLRRVHYKKFVCTRDGCGKRFPTQGLLEDHIRESYTNEKPFECDICGEFFASRNCFLDIELLMYC